MSRSPLFFFSPTRRHLRGRARARARPAGGSVTVDSDAPPRASSPPTPPSPEKAGSGGGSRPVVSGQRRQTELCRSVQRQTGPRGLRARLEVGRFLWCRERELGKYSTILYVIRVISRMIFGQTDQTSVCSCVHMGIDTIVLKNIIRYTL